MLMRISCRLSTPVNSSLVNRLPWPVLNIYRRTTGLDSFLQNIDIIECLDQFGHGQIPLDHR